MSHHRFLMRRLITLVSALVLLFVPGSPLRQIKADDRAWEPLNPPATSVTLHDVWGSSGSDVFAVGGNDTILHYNGTTWSPMSSGFVSYPRAVWGSSGSDVFAAGGGPDAMLHYDGATWRRMSVGTDMGLNGMWGSSGHDVYAVGQIGLIQHYDGTGWSNVYHAGETTFADVWGTSSSDVFVVGAEGGIHFPFSGIILHYDGTDWNLGLRTGVYVNAIWGSSSSDVFAVGSQGTILHYNGTDWNQMTSGTTSSLTDIWGNSGSDVFAVGSNGTILHYNGSDWSPMSSGTTEALSGVWGSSGSDVFAVGSQGTILHYSGSSDPPSTYSVSGTVRDGTMDPSTGLGEPLSGVTITADTGASAVSKADGTYTITGLAPGPHLLTATKPSYAAEPVEATIDGPPDVVQDFTIYCDDRDKDALCDVWEESGYKGLNLPAMGADPDHKDIFVEVDYMAKPNTCVRNICVPGFSYQPKPKAIARVVEAFSVAPVGNPDGKPGISLHVDYGSDAPMKYVQGEWIRWRDLSRANALLHLDLMSWEHFEVFKNHNFEEQRQHVFRYAIFGDRIEGLYCYSGWAHGSDFMVTLGGWTVANFCRHEFRWATGTQLQQAGTFMHELGHTLGLEHGGRDDIDHKPNYFSVMNRSFQVDGLIIGGKGGHFGYSGIYHSQIPQLDESALDEMAGIGNSPYSSDYGTVWFCNATWESRRETDNANGPIDWNCSGKPIDQRPVQASINRNTDATQVMHNYEDWHRLDFGAGGKIGGVRPQALAAATTNPHKELTLENALAMPVPYRVGTIGGGVVAAAPGVTVTYVMTVTNGGQNADTYDLSAVSASGWSETSSIPSSISLEPGESYTLTARIAVPLEAASGMSEEIRIAVSSQANPLIADVAYCQASVLNGLYLPVIFRN